MQNVKIVAMTGTPVINDPFETAILFNINGIELKTKPSETPISKYVVFFNEYLFNIFVIILNLLCGMF